MKPPLFKYSLIMAFISLIPGIYRLHAGITDSAGSAQLTKIFIASEPDYPPYCIVDKKGNPDGFAVELFKAAAKAAGIEVNIKIGLWEKIKHDLAEGNIDALPFVGRTPEREDLFDFTLPFLSLHGAIFVRTATTGINSLEDLKGKRIGVMKGDNAEEFVRRENVSDILYTTLTFEEAFRMLASGEIDAVITQRLMGLELLKTLKLKKIKPLDLQLPEFRQDFCFAVKKGNTVLLSRLNEGLSIVIANNSFNEIQLKWFGPAVNEKITFRDVLRISLFLLIPIIAVTSILSITILRREVKIRTRLLRKEVKEHLQTVQTLHNHQILSEKMEKLAGIGAWEYDTNTQKVKWTKGVYRIFGVSRSGFDPSFIDIDMDFYHPDDRIILYNAFHEALSTGKPYDLELRIITPKRIEKWVRTSGHTEIVNQKVTRIYGSVMDITESKHAKDKLISERKRFQQVLDAFPLGIYIIDGNYNIEYVNPVMIKEFGVPNRLKCYEYLHNSDSPCSECNTEKIARGESSIRTWVSEKNNRIYDLYDIPLPNDDGTISIIAIFHDITEQKTAEEAIRLSESNFREIFNSTNEAIFIVDANTGKMLDLNQRAIEMYGYPSKEEMLKRNFSDFSAGDKTYNEELAQEYGQKTMNEGPQTFDWLSRKKNGESFWAEVSLKNVEISGESRIISVVRDITERKRVELELLVLKENLEIKVEERTKELNEQIQKLDKSQKAMLYMVEDLNNTTSELNRERQNLQVMNKELESFSYSVSHDLRSPLRAISGFSSILTEDYAEKLDDEGKRICSIIHENTQRMGQLIDDLLAFSKLGRTEMYHIPVDMQEMVNSIYNELTTPEIRKKIIFNAHNLYSVPCDQTLIRQVWVNLISNAIKFTSGKKPVQIEISGKKNKTICEYSVRDNGVGFDMKFRDKLFGVFQRLHSQQEFEGTGVGLAIVQRIVARHGGEVKAEGEVNKGAVFSFSLPLIAENKPTIKKENNEKL